MNYCPFCAGLLHGIDCDDCDDYRAEIEALDGPSPDSPTDGIDVDQLYQAAPPRMPRSIASRHTIGGHAHVTR